LPFRKIFFEIFLFFIFAKKSIMSRGVKKGSIRGPYRRKSRPKKYVCSCSFGKDSLATLLLAIEKGEPLDAVVYTEVMYDNVRGISGEYPLHVRWIDEVAIPKLRSMGVEVIRLRSENDYVGCFNKVIVNGKHKGKRRGFPIARMCCIQRECKLQPIKRWYKEEYFSKGYDVVSYVGIAIDEVERLGRLEESDSPKVSKVSLLAKYGYTETMALLKCHEYGLLSPIYFNGGGRNGCWFCPNQGISDFCRLRRGFPELWNELRELDKIEGLSSDRFKYAESLGDIDKKVDEYEQKYFAYL
jgi:3'-phosphoadenosine 5'-phosphosulfate sulfotransferase (PAPS reductase)/FAD synthetase